jgi:hypothetical protein
VRTITARTALELYPSSAEPRPSQLRMQIYTATLARDHPRAFAPFDESR